MNKKELDSLIDEIQRLKDIYESGSIDSATAGNNHRLYALLEDFDMGLLWDRVADLQDMRKLLAYRVDSLSRADRHVKALGLSPLIGKSCGQWSGMAYEKCKGEDWNRFSRVNDVVVVVFDVLFPVPVGLFKKHFYGKCLDYVVMVLSTSGMSLRGIKEKVEDLVKMEREREGSVGEDARNQTAVKGE